MRKNISIPLLSVFGILVVLSGCDWLVQKEPSQNPLPTINESEAVVEEGRLDPALCQETIEGGIVKIDNEDFRLDEEGLAYGQFSFEGSVMKKEEPAAFSGESIDVVYLLVDDDGSIAFDYFISYAEKNDSINKVATGSLYFKLGVLENDALKLGAEITEGTEEKILSALESGESLRLTMLQAVTLGSGANEYSVMPCVIDAD